jgi:hypothetical protein
MYCVTSDPAAIPFADLPQRFVVKPTHGSGWVRVVLDKATLDVEELLNTCNRWLTSNYYDRTRERQYRKITPRILVEEFIDDGSGAAPMDYKFFTFYGKVHLIQIDGSRFTQHRCALYDRHWRDTGARVQLERFDGPVREPPNLQLMLETAETLGADLDFVRVDLYDVGNRIYFGEMTSTPGGGFACFDPQAMDEHLGRLWGGRPSVQRFREPGVAGLVFHDFADAGEREVLGVKPLAGVSGLGDERYSAGGAGGLVGIERDVP